MKFAQLHYFYHKILGGTKDIMPPPVQKLGGTCPPINSVPGQMCVLSRLTVYVMGGQDWDRLDNFLVTRCRPFGNKVTNANCQS